MACYYPTRSSRRRLPWATRTISNAVINGAVEYHKALGGNAANLWGKIRTGLTAPGLLCQGPEPLVKLLI